MANDPREELCPGLHIVRVITCNECISYQPEHTQLHSLMPLIVRITHVE